MVSVNYQVFGNKFGLRLRLYKNGEVRYVSVTKYLRGEFSKRQFSAKKQCFVGSAPLKDLNNKFLEEFRKPYDELGKDWDGTLSGFLIAIGQGTKEQEDTSSLHWLIRKFITEKQLERHKDGSIKGTWEAYDKTERRLREYFCTVHQHYLDIAIQDMKVDLVNDILEYLEGHRGEGSKYYVSQCLHAVFNWADKMGYFDFSTLKGVRWAKKNKESVHKYQTLTKEQCNAFVNLKKSELPTNPRNPQWAWKAQLYHDFCVFILYTCQSPCDALCLKYDDIQTINGVDHFVFKRRKIAGKQSTDCSVPINDRMRKIMKRWKSKAKDGYIFPVRNNSTIRRNANNNNDIDKFIQRVNLWLKKVGPIIGVPFKLHNYVFRHTGITHYISTGVPIIYVANLAGTSVKNCEAIYYNNQGDTSSRDMVLAATEF